MFRRLRKAAEADRMAAVSLRLVVSSNVTVEPGHYVVSVNVSSNLHLIVARRLVPLETHKEFIKPIVRVADELFMDCFVAPAGRVISNCNDLAVRSLVAFRAMATLHIDTAQTRDRLHVLARPMAVAKVLQGCIKMCQVEWKYIWCSTYRPSAHDTTHGGVKFAVLPRVFWRAQSNMMHEATM